MREMFHEESCVYSSMRRLRGSVSKSAKSRYESPASRYN